MKGTSRCAAIVLAAGSSSRLGRPKQFVQLGHDPDSETLLERAVRIAAEAGLWPIYVVAQRPDGLERVQAVGDGAVVWVQNEHATEGMAASIRLGVSAVRNDSAGVIVLACDQPAVTAKHLWRLAAGGDRIVASGYAGRKGVPAYFPTSQFGALMALGGDAGAREIVRTALTIELPLGEVDIDTAEDLARARQLFG